VAPNPRPEIPAFQEVVGLAVRDAAVVGRSIQRAWDPICMPEGREVHALLNVTHNRALSWLVDALVEEGGALEIRIRDPFGTPILEWRFDPSPDGMLMDQPLDAST
jgi:hypothetical protein